MSNPENPTHNSDFESNSEGKPAIDPIKDPLLYLGFVDAQDFDYADEVNKVFYQVLAVVKYRREMEYTRKGKVPTPEENDALHKEVRAQFAAELEARRDFLESEYTEPPGSREHVSLEDYVLQRAREYVRAQRSGEGDKVRSLGDELEQSGRMGEFKVYLEAKYGDEIRSLAKANKGAEAQELMKAAFAEYNELKKQGTSES